jgi:hypothetical protein
VRYFRLDLARMQTEFKPGIMIDLQPFPGTFAVGVDPNEPAAKAGPPIRDAKGRTSTLRPWKNGSNMGLSLSGTRRAPQRRRAAEPVSCDEPTARCGTNDYGGGHP